MGFSAKLANLFTLEKTLLASLCVSALRFAWYATCPSSSLLLAFFFLQGMAYGIMLIEFLRYIAKVVDEEDFGLAVSVYYGYGFSLSAILCQMAGGVILDYFGIGGVFSFFAVMNAVGVVLYIALKMHVEHIQNE